eukprot:2449223-Amphidinium_carterae.1
MPKYAWQEEVPFSFLTTADLQGRCLSSARCAPSGAALPKGSAILLPSSYKWGDLRSGELQLKSHAIKSGDLQLKSDAMESGNQGDRRFDDMQWELRFKSDANQ